jgi:hypothetical protein
MSEVILVEGVGDADFVIGFLAKVGKTGVGAFPPKPLGGSGNGVGNVISIIPLLINKILTGDFTKAAIVVDADYTGINGGFVARRAEIVNKLSDAGYVVPPMPATGSPPGEIFIHPSGQAPIGLFIMPNHHDDGMLEDLLKQMVVDAPCSALLQHAVNVVSAPPAKFFNLAIHSSKAEIATFLAWQKRPPAHVNVCVEQDIFLATSPAANDFLQWVNRVF